MGCLAVALVLGYRFICRAVRKGQYLSRQLIDETAVLQTRKAGQHEGPRGFESGSGLNTEQA